MKGQPMWAVLAAAVLLAASGLSSCAKPQAGDGGGPSGVVMTACSRCHDTGRICEALGKKDRDAWGVTVDRMVAKGAAVSRDSVPEVVEYLANLKPGSAPVCKE